MPQKGPAQSSLKPVDDASGIELPPRFAEALELVRATIARCDEAGIPSDTLIAALMTELMPRLVQVYGSESVALMLDQLAVELQSSDPAPMNRQ